MRFFCTARRHSPSDNGWERRCRIPRASIAFAKTHPEVEVHIYAADHGFHCDQRGSYDQAAAQLANERTLAFFAKHLG